MDFNDRRLWYGVAVVIVVLLVIAHQIAVPLWNKAACGEFLWINKSLLFPFIHLLIPAQVVITGNNYAALGGEVKALDQA